jgi:hypothetical protein
MNCGNGYSFVILMYSYYLRYFYFRGSKSGGYEVHIFWSYKSEDSVESQRAFRRSMSPLSDLENGGEMFLRIIG